MRDGVDPMMAGSPVAKPEISAFQDLGEANPFNDGLDNGLGGDLGGGLDGGQGLFGDGDDFMMDIGGDNNF